MPEAPLRPCLHPACGELVPNGRCDQHAREYNQRSRGTTAERGCDQKWLNFAAWFLRRHPNCVGSGDVPWDDWRPHESELVLNCRNTANEVHHRKKLADSPALRTVETNCLPQCESCHAVRTRRGE